MRRILRFLINVLALLSLLLCLAAVALWVRSYWVGDGFVWKPSDVDQGYYRGYVGRGHVRLGTGAYRFGHAAYFDYDSDESPTRQRGFRPGTLTDRIGFEYHSGSDSQGQPVQDLYFPVWGLVACTAILPAWRFRALRRSRRTRRRATAGACASCGYDLRATPDRCPECGATPSPGEVA